MPMDRHGGPHAPAPGPRSAFAPAARRLLRPLAALSLVAGLTAGCGSASTPLEVYQNCLSCGYDFSTPIPTAAAALRRSEAARTRTNPMLVVNGRDDLS